MDEKKISDYFGHEVTVLLLGQSQLSISPGLKTRGVLVGAEQGVYIIKRTGGVSEDEGSVMMIPMGQCRLALE